LHKTAVYINKKLTRK